MTDEFISLFWGLFISVIEIVLLYYFFAPLETNARINIKKWQAYILIFFAEVCMTCLGINSYAKLLILTLMVFALCNILYSVKISKAALLTLVYVMLLIVSEVMAFAIIKVFNPTILIEKINQILVLKIEATIISKCLNFILLSIVNKILNKKRDEYGIREFVLMFVPAIANIILLVFVLNFSYLSVASGEKTGVDMLFVSFIMAVSSVLLILFFEKFMRNKDNEQRLQLMEQQIKMQNKYYQDKEIVTNQVKKMYHDMKNHLIAMQRMDDDLNYNDYIEELNHHLEDYQTYVETGNKMVDVLMNEKIMMMNQFDINYTGLINLEFVGFMKDPDVITIFGNAVDNAIEATKQITQGERYIKITTVLIGQFYMIKFVNSMEGKLHIDNNRILTTKGNRHAHGIGLGNIENAVRKYGGNMQIKADNNQFELTIMIPIQKNDQL